jgi:hypothetical protein
MPSNTKLDPNGERAEATEAMESTPISGKDHEYQADGDHHPRQGATAQDGGQSDGGGQAGATEDTAPKVGVETERHISEGIPAAGRSPEANSMPDASRQGGPRA